MVWQVDMPLRSEACSRVAPAMSPSHSPPSWIEAKDKLDLNTPLNMATTNETVGGNSGSPLINEKGELIGVVFDTNLVGRGDTYLYLADARAVSVDSGCLVEVLSKIYDASRIVDEIASSN